MITKGKWKVAEDIDMECQAEQLVEKDRTDEGWVAIGIAHKEDDGFSEVLALAHPDNAELIASAPETLRQRDDLLKVCKATLEFIGRSSKTDWDNEITPVLEQAIAEVEGK